MSNQAHILILDDDPADVFLVKYNLKKRLENCVYHVAENKEQYCDALANQQFDVIISDSSILGITAPEAFALARARYAETSFFIFSGSIPQELTALAEKIGVTASIEKHRIKDLVEEVVIAVGGANRS